MDDVASDRLRAGIGEKGEGEAAMEPQFSGKTVVVTGGSRGIGRAIATAFALRGAQTVLAASSPDTLSGAAHEIERAGGQRPVVCAQDMRTLAGCEAVLAAVQRATGRCDVLVNSAGATRAGSFLTLDDEAWSDGFALKYFSCVRMCRLLWPMLRETSGNVINVVGGAARSPDPEFLIGGSANAAVANFSKGLSKLGNVEGINVNVIHPGMTQTDRLQQLFEQRAAASGRNVEDVKASILDRNGVKQFVEPESIAELAIYLASTRAHQINGVAIAVDNGETPGLF